MRYIVLNALFAVALFIINVILGKLLSGNPLFAYGRFTFNLDEGQSFAGNFFLKIINPTVYMAILCAVLQALGWIKTCYSLWMLIPFYWLLRAISMIVKNIFLYSNWKYEIIAFLMSIVLGEGVFFILLKPLMNKSESVLISHEALRDAVWYAIIAYVLKMLWDVYKTYLNSENIYPRYLIKKTVRKKYAKFSEKYGIIIDKTFNDHWPEGEDGFNDVLKLVYAIMIFEDYNRPKVFRAVEYIIKAFRPEKTMSLGIMQFRSKKIISNNTSIELAVEKIINAYFVQADVDRISYVIDDYNYYGENSEDIKAIYEMI